MSSRSARLLQLSAADFRTRLPEALAVYTTAMGYAPGTAEQRAPTWLAHIQREGWRNVVALDTAGSLIGLTYGYRGMAGQWWHEQVRKGFIEGGSKGASDDWLDDYFELTELHVRPPSQAHGIGEELLRKLLDDVPQSKVLLSTPEGTTRAWRLYRRLGFQDILRHHYFAGDPRPFAVLGRRLPL
ncbi:GNAT family N-acetyltransferase [Haloechinothrix sp. LS1_15]|nr:GNAT family N-acetyltransferase [Haloechinothrix sp. LS1_15]